MHDKKELQYQALASWLNYRLDGWRSHREQNYTSKWDEYFIAATGKPAKGATKTPKTDMILGSANISLKKYGGSQLMSGGKSETLATLGFAYDNAPNSIKSKAFDSAWNKLNKDIEKYKCGIFVSNKEDLFAEALLSAIDTDYKTSDCVNYVKSSYDIDIVSNGTANHMFLVNLVKNEITGKVLDAALGQANITVNKNSVPNDPQSPFVTSGIRIGTPAVTRRGFKEAEMDLIATWIKNIIHDVENESLISKTRNEVTELCNQFPVYSK